MFDNNKQLVLDLDTYMNLYAKACHFWVISEEAWQRYYRLKCSCCRIFIQIAFYCVDTVCVLSLLTFFESRQIDGFFLILLWLSLTLLNRSPSLLPLVLTGNMPAIRFNDILIRKSWGCPVKIFSVRKGVIFSKINLKHAGNPNP